MSGTAGGQPERMNSPQRRHEVRLRGLGGRAACGVPGSGASAAGASHPAGSTPEGMNSPLGGRKVRLRGLRGGWVLGAVLTVAVLATGAAGQTQGGAEDSVGVVGMRVEPDTVTVGDRFRAAVFVRAPAGSRVQLAIAPAADASYQTIGEARAYPPDSSGVHRVVATMVMWVTDPAASARAGVSVTLPGGASRSIPIQLPLPAVRATLPADSTQPRAPKDIIPTPRRDWRWAWIAAVLLAALAMLAFWLWRRRRQPRIAPPTDPRAHALAELDRLHASGLAEGEVEAFSAATGAILREFAAAVEPALSPDLTTSELLERLVETGARADDVAAIQSALSRADLAKFARRRPSTEGALEDWAASRRWVEAYRPASAPELVEAGR